MNKYNKHIKHLNKILKELDDLDLSKENSSTQYDFQIDGQMLTVYWPENSDLPKVGDETHFVLDSVLWSAIVQKVNVNSRKVVIKKHLPLRKE